MWSVGNHYKVYQGLINGSIELPSIGSHFANLKHQVESNNFNLAGSPVNQQLLIALSADHDLSQLLINGANQSRYYGSPLVTSLSTAITRLAPKKISDLITFFAIRDVVLPDNLPANHYIRNLWEDTLQLSAICCAINYRLTQTSGVHFDHSALAGLVVHLGTIMLLTTFRNSGLTVPSHQQIEDVPDILSCNIASLAALHWQMDPAISECALRKSQYNEVNFDKFSILDVLHMAITLHRKNQQKDIAHPALKHSFPFIKAVKQRLIREEADHFTQMVEGHALAIFQGLSPLINKYPVNNFIRHNPSQFRKQG